MARFLENRQRGTIISRSWLADKIVVKLPPETTTQVMKLHSTGWNKDRKISRFRKRARQRHFIWFSHSQTVIILYNNKNAYLTLSIEKYTLSSLALTLTHSHTHAPTHPSPPIWHKLRTCLSGFYNELLLLSANNGNRQLPRGVDIGKMKASVHPTITYLHREGKHGEIMEVGGNNPCDLYELLAVVILKTVDLLSLRTKSADV